ncbi:hypothetical protein R5R35_003185 [Gryllus longicercus]|uniref:glutathione transferase n=1 Tax=Gryllus longicercus TaxID=2509291 RepID=A0AAN9VUW5_9ORTH
MATKYKLNYFNTRGQGEAIRFLLSYGEVPFEDNRVSIHEWHQLKRATPFGKLPTLEVNNEVGYQTLAVCRYLGRQFKIAGNDAWEEAQIDAVADTIKDLNTETLDVYLAPDCESKEKLREKLVNETFPFYFSKLDKMVLDNGGFFVGGQLSWVDIFFTSGVEGYNVVGMDEDLLKNYPNLSDLNKNIRSLPAIQSWLKKRPFSAF